MPRLVGIYSIPLSLFQTLSLMFVYWIVLVFLMKISISPLNIFIISIVVFLISGMTYLFGQIFPWQLHSIVFSMIITLLSLFLKVIDPSIQQVFTLFFVVVIIHFIFLIPYYAYIINQDVFWNCFDFNHFSR